MFGILRKLSGNNQPDGLASPVNVDVKSGKSLVLLIMILQQTSKKEKSSQRGVIIQVPVVTRLKRRTENLTSVVPKIPQIVTWILTLIVRSHKKTILQIDFLLRHQNGE